MNQTAALCRSRRGIVIAAMPYLQAIAEPGIGLTKRIEEKAAEIHDLLGPGANCIAVNLQRMQQHATED